MTIKQISVFLENKKGRLAELTDALANAGVDLVALSIADTTQFGILRAIVNDTQLAVNTLRECGFTVNVTDVLAVVVPNKPGGLAGVLRLMTDADISVEYLYSFVGNHPQGALILFRVEQPEHAAKILQDGGVQLLKADQLR